MRRVFADTVYWVARINPRDQWHAVYKSLTGLRQVTTDEVLDEVLTYFSGYGPALRSRAAQIVRQILAHPGVEVVAQSRQSFLDGLSLYEARPDKGYSLTDCISMETMRREGLTEVLTQDVHFIQEGFITLP